MSQEDENGATAYREEILAGANQAVTKFNENFFMKKHMKTKSSEKKVEEAIGVQSE